MATVVRACAGAQAAASRIEPVDLLPRRHERIVHKVLRLFPIGNDAQRNGQGDRRMPVVDLAQRIPVSRPDLLRQERLVVERL